MAQLRPKDICKSHAAAMFLRIAAVFLFCTPMTLPGLVNAQDQNARILASELLIVSGDLARLDDPTLSRQNVQGLRKRIDGALGLLPWLLKQAGELESADTLMAVQAAGLEKSEQRRSLAVLIKDLISQHMLDVSTFEQPLTAISIRESRAIHEAYCAGCHDEAGHGDPEQLFPARDLFLMARQETPELFLARLFNGIKGDASIGFRNPMTDEQLNALWKYYLFH